MPEAKVSIIVPIYNVEQYVEKCLISLMNQTFRDIEIWAISDGSPDNSVEIVKKYAKQDSRIKCIEKENGGYGSVLEYAIKNIATKYFLICDPDDWVTNDAVEVLYNTAEKNNVDLVVGAKYLVYADNNEEVYEPTFNSNLNANVETNKVYSRDNGLEDALFLLPSPHSKLYKTEMAKNIKFPKKVSYTDLLLYLVYLNNCNSCIYIDNALSYYLVDREGNSMTDAKPKILKDHYEVLASILDQIEGKEQFEQYYFKILCQLRFVLKESKKVKECKEKEENLKLVYTILQRLMNHKKSIAKYDKAYGTTKLHIHHMLLLNKLTSKIFFNRLVK